MTDDELIEAMAHEMWRKAKEDDGYVGDFWWGGECVAVMDGSFDLAAFARAVLSLAKPEIERRVVEELMEPNTDVCIIGSKALDFHERMEDGAPEETARKMAEIRGDKWMKDARVCFRAMLRASPLYARVHGSEKEAKPRPPDCADPANCGWHKMETDPPTNHWICSHMDCPHTPQALSEKGER